MKRTIFSLLKSDINIMNFLIFIFLFVHLLAWTTGLNSFKCFSIVVSTSSTHLLHSSHNINSALKNGIYSNSIYYYPWSTKLYIIICFCLLFKFLCLLNLLFLNVFPVLIYMFLFLSKSILVFICLMSAKKVYLMFLVCFIQFFVYGLYDLLLTLKMTYIYV